MKADDRRAQSLTGSEPGWMTDIRERSIGRFEGMQWPTPQEEEWRRTDLSEVDLDAYLGGASEPVKASSDGGDFGDPIPGDSKRVGIRYLDETLVGFNLSPELTKAGVYLAPLGQGIRDLATDARLIDTEPHVRRAFAEAAEATDNRLAAWNDGAWRQGAFLFVPKNVSIEAPIFLDFDTSEDARLTIPRVFVLLGDGARAVVVARFIGGAAGGLCNAAADIHLGDAARLEYASVQDLHGGSMFFLHERASIGRDAVINHFGAILGSRLSKTRLEVDIEASGGEAQLSGMYYAGDGQHMDLRTVQRHLSDHGSSRASYRGAVNPGGRTVFQGLIEVSPEGPGTDAYLSNRNLVLGDGARADSIPSLRIRTDDVKCSHGSTTGRLNGEELYYLMARGIPRREAESMLVEGFFAGVIDKAPLVLREDLAVSIRSKMESEEAWLDG